ncbi:MAG: EAL domain-containing protein [Eubacteriales bacterium]
MLTELEQLLINKSLRILYQPLVSLYTGQVFGYEALSRGPEGSPLESPTTLFDFAANLGFLYQLDNLSREKAIEGMSEFLPNQKLFLNIEPEIIADPLFSAGRTVALLERYNLTPRDVVFEITERTSIKDFNKFRRVLEHYRKQGFMVAIDDVGAGYSSLQSIAELHPDFIKIDMSLIKGIDNHPIKKALIETFVNFAQKINSELIAEGIETAEEFTTLVKMGIHYGQGYFLARPDNPPPQVSTKASAIFTRSLTSFNETKSVYHLIKSLPCEVKSIPPSTIVSDVAKYFGSNKNERALVVTKHGQPVGLIMRDKLFQKLSHPYGPAIYHKKPVTNIMDANPLIIESNTPINIAASLATNRSSLKLYDYIIITETKRFLGAVSVQSLLDIITNQFKEPQIWEIPHPLLTNQFTLFNN